VGLVAGALRRGARAARAAGGGRVAVGLAVACDGRVTVCG
jgi:hypothetical protein